MLYEPNGVYLGDAKDIASHIQKDSVGLSVWSPPYHVGKDYEKDMSFFEWKNLLRRTIEAHVPILKPGGFLVINIADILCFRDRNIPRIMANNVSRRKRNDITREQVLAAWGQHPEMNRRQIAALLGCSEQTVDRRMRGNNIRGGKYETQTRVLLVGGLIEEYAYEAGLYLYDRRVWVKDAAWENSKWHTMSYRAVDEFEYIYVFWKPGITTVDRKRLSKDEWKAWGSRAVWYIPSVRANDDHEAKFPLELPRRVIRLLSEPGDLVLDCFVGSGTSAVAAILEKRRFIGVDNHPPSVLMARKAMDVAIHEVLSRLDLEEQSTEPVSVKLPKPARSNDACQPSLLLEKRGVYDFHNEVT
jgi:site-specific DNA-methyltransferase (adenine-specific)